MRKSLSWPITFPIVPLKDSPLFYKDQVTFIISFISLSVNVIREPGSLWQYYKSEAVLNTAAGIINFPGDSNSASFKFKQKITGQAINDRTKHDEIILLLKCLSNFSRTLEVPLIDCEGRLALTWPANCLQ